MQGGEPQDGRTDGLLSLPQRSHHELQVGRRNLDPARRRGVSYVVGDRLLVRIALNLLEHRFGQARLNAHPFVLAPPGVEVGQRLLDRCAGGFGVEVLEMEVVAVDVAHPPTQEVTERRVGVLTDRDEEVGSEVRLVDALSQLVGKPLYARLPSAVKEILLELIEDDQQGRTRPLRAIAGHRALECQNGHVDGRPRESRGRSSCDAESPSREFVAARISSISSWVGSSSTR